MDSLVPVGYLIMIALIIVIFLLPLIALPWAISLWKIAGQCGIKHRWMAFLPVATNWIAGSIADRYREGVKGKQSRNRFVLTATALVQAVLFLVSLFWVNGVSTVVITLLMPVKLVVRTICVYHIYRALRVEKVSAAVNTALGVLFPLVVPFILLFTRKDRLDPVMTAAADCEEN